MDRNHPSPETKARIQGSISQLEKVSQLKKITGISNHAPYESIYI